MLWLLRPCRRLWLVLRSLSAPTVAAAVGQALPKVMETMSPLQSYFGSKNSGVGDGTRPSDYQVENLHPFDSNEVIFSEQNAKST
jgi:hypothetical protein